MKLESKLVCQKVLHMGVSRHTVSSDAYLFWYHTYQCLVGYGWQKGKLR